MTDEYERTHLWKSTLAKQKKDEDELARDRLRGAYLKFRDRVSLLVSAIGHELPGLTVHDITHLDALWRVADQIAGPKYALTPADAFVLGGAILLHDSAHAIAAFAGGKADIKQTQHWSDLIAHRYNRQEPAIGSDDERTALFQVLRHLHATQAAKLPFVSWKAPSDATPLFLLEDTELRQTYGELIGRIAESHHWPAHRVATDFGTVTYTPPSYLPGAWTVDAMKIAFLLRTADAAHVDDKRAPWFLFALQKPEGISEQHWRFQSKLGQPLCNKHGELQISSASSFSADERDAWWLAYDTVQMIDRELRDARGLMRDHGREVFQATSVLGAGSPESFARYVQPKDWEPVDVAPKIGNVSKIIEMLGGEKLYGDHPEYALRELLQNAIDAIHAKRALGGLGPEEGEIVVALDKIDDDNYQLSVTDNGIGMSKYVMTNVLLDFGNSLWKSDAMRDQLPGLAESGFVPAGRFGIGFFSVFMLAQRVHVESVSYANRRAAYALEFHDGLSKRPTLRALAGEAALDSGTTVVLDFGQSVVVKLLALPSEAMQEIDWISQPEPDDHGSVIMFDWRERATLRLKWWVRHLCPMVDISIYTQVGSRSRHLHAASAWTNESAASLFNRATDGETGHVAFTPTPFFDEHGKLAGRMGVGGWSAYDPMLLTHNGLLCGVGQDFFGVLRASGPDNAARTEARIKYPLRCWQAWAAEYLESNKDCPTSALLVLHALLPERDFPVYEDHECVCTAAEVVALESAQRRLAFHVGDIEFDEDEDNFTRREFRSSFVQNEGLFVVPNKERRLPNFLAYLGLQPIDYEQRLVAAAREKWSNSHHYRTHEAVGRTNGGDVYRMVSRITTKQNFASNETDDGDHVI